MDGTRFLMIVHVSCVILSSLFSRRSVPSKGPLKTSNTLLELPYISVSVLVYTEIKGAFISKCVVTKSGNMVLQEVLRGEINGSILFLHKEVLELCRLIFGKDISVTTIFLVTV